MQLVRNLDGERTAGGYATTVAAVDHAGAIKMATADPPAVNGERTTRLDGLVAGLARGRRRTGHHRQPSTRLTNQLIV